MASRDKKLEHLSNLVGTMGGEFTAQDIADHTNGLLSYSYVNSFLVEQLKLNKLHARGGRPRYFSHAGIWENVDLNDKSSDKSDEEPLAQQVIGKPKIPVDDQFEMIEQFTGMIARKEMPSFLLTGMAGVGKTYTVKKEFEDRGLKPDEDYLEIGGKAAPLGLFKVLHDNRDATIIFDDCDDVMKDPVSVNILKKALDLYKTRRISWFSRVVEKEGLDQAFDFTGQVIFISNIDLSRIHEALKSRAFRVNIRLTPEEIMERIRFIMPHIKPNDIDMSMEKKQDALDAMDESRDEIMSWGCQIDIRTFEKACLLRNSVDDIESWNKIKKMIKYQLID